MPHAPTSHSRPRAARVFLLLALLVGVPAVGLWAVAGWMQKGPTASSGGLFFPARVVLPVPHFLQNDPSWGGEPLGPTRDTLGEVGCAVASAAMVLASYGLDTDPGRLNAFLTQLPGGYTPQGWIYWEKAVEIEPGRAAELLPHYEDAPSHFLIDWNLLRGNPVIVRLRYPNGVTHFLVVCGKQGFDYLVLDPGSGGRRGVYPLREFGSPIEALRFYRKPA